VVAVARRLRTSGPEVHQSGMARICWSPYPPVAIALRLSVAGSSRPPL
jgi:hypothetical protein